MRRYRATLGSLGAYLRGVLDHWYMHTARTLRRQRERGVIFQFPERDGEPFDIVDPAPDHVAAANERMDLEDLLASLPRDERWLAEELKYKSVAEIAEDAGVHRGTVYRRLASLRAIWPQIIDEKS